MTQHSLELAVSFPPCASLLILPLDRCATAPSEIPVSGSLRVTVRTPEPDLCRHNGIIVSPVYIAEIKQDTEGEGSNASASNSRVGTPSKGKSKATSVPGNTASAPVYTLVARPETSAPLSGSQSYYRQHTINPGAFIPY